MPNPFARWFKSAKPAGEQAQPAPPGPSPAQGESLEKRLARLDREADDAPPGYRGTALNRAGDICYKLGDREKALAYYGRAIDAYLEEEQPESARGVARKIIRLHPTAVRTLCTLTWLDLAAGHRADALSHLGRYVEAARRAGREKIATEQVLEMARAVRDPEFRSAAADALQSMGEHRAAGDVREWPGDADVTAPTEELVARCFAAAVGSNEHRRQEGAVA